MALSVGVLLVLVATCLGYSDDEQRVFTYAPSPDEQLRFNQLTTEKQLSEVLGHEQPALVFIDAVWSVFSRRARALMDSLATLTNGTLDIYRIAYYNWYFDGLPLLESWWAREHMPGPIGGGVGPEYMHDKPQVVSTLWPDSPLHSGPTLPWPLREPEAFLGMGTGNLGGKYRFAIRTASSADSPLTLLPSTVAPTRSSWRRAV
ncbi:hypothetical protein PAPYR_1226 [Paratrimastix pyriformis]|uniref:Uncharacterized protein n=1 Tax=Paratrimastix pyriformis TaxID=342808 RepID=A0ABQ8USF2_9EUKA|nr:hypothetical protein PAPYR_1226 [Paratrimastix pyriformis]